MTSSQRWALAYATRDRSHRDHACANQRLRGPRQRLSEPTLAPALAPTLAPVRAQRLPEGPATCTQVGAGQTNTYTYVLPDNHMGGTFWYHPHHHGSTAMHAGGGAAGMLIVEDRPGALPGEIEALEEMVFVLLHLNMPELTAVAQQFETNCQNAGGTAAQCDDTVWANGASAGTQSNSVLVNGMDQPTVSKAHGRFKVNTMYSPTSMGGWMMRWRFSTMYFNTPGNGGATSSIPIK